VHAVHEQRPVGQAGEAVVQRIVLEAQLGHAAVGHVGHRPGHPGGAAVVAARGQPAGQHAAPAAVGGSDARRGAEGTGPPDAPGSRRAGAPNLRGERGETRQPEAGRPPDGGAPGSRRTGVRSTACRRRGPNPRSRRWQRGRPGRSAPRSGPAGHQAAGWPPPVTAAPLRPARALDRSRFPYEGGETDAKSGFRASSRAMAVALRGKFRKAEARTSISGALLRRGPDYSMPRRSSTRSSARQCRRTRTDSSRCTWLPSSRSMVLRAAVPIALIMRPPEPMRMPF
jgi:hypothetical protein